MEAHGGLHGVPDNVGRRLFVLLSSASLNLLMDCLQLGAFFLIVAERDAVVTIYIAKVFPSRLYGDPASRDTS